VNTALAGLTVEGYAAHSLHAHDRIWVETNCYVDPWIELVHSLGLEPRALLAFCLGADFEGDQFTFLKPPLEDLRRLYGVGVRELNVWRPVDLHIEEQLALGRLITVEVDSFHLPDTRGVAYEIDHVKTTVVPARIDRSGHSLDYFHNAGFHRLDGADYAAIFDAPALLPPYAEIVDLSGLSTDPARLRDTAATLAREHLQRAPVDNPMLRLGKRVAADLEWLVEEDLETFHRYAFGICRQSGAAAQLAADFVEWLDPSLAPAAAGFREAAEQARVLQLTLTRAVRGRRYDIDTPITAMADAWSTAMELTTVELLHASHAR